MKKKMTTQMMSVLAIAMSLFSCTNDNDVSTTDSAAVRFTAGIGHSAVVATPASRAAGTSWAADDAIGIFMVANGTTTIAEEAANRRFTTSAGDGNFAPLPGHEIYYPMDDSPVDFIAYYPYAAEAAWDTALPVSTAGKQTTATQATIDLLWAKAENHRKSSATGPVNLRFSHRLSKLTMRCKLDPSIGTAVQPDDIAVSIHGMSTAATFSPQTGDVKLLETPTTPDNPAAPTDITPRKLNGAPTDYVAAYDAIILPANYRANKLTVGFTINRETFTWDVGVVTFESGKNHIYDVLITRTGVEANATIEDWTPENMGSVEAQ